MYSNIQFVSRFIFYDTFSIFFSSCLSLLAAFYIVLKQHRQRVISSDSMTLHQNE